MKNEALAAFFREAFAYCIEQHIEEVAVTEERTFEEQTYWSFFRQYVYVVLNSGMKNAVAEKIYYRFMENSCDLQIIGHPGKREAIKDALENYKQWFTALRANKDKLAYLESLPFIGKITKYHLARNLGLDYVKPDRHLVKIAANFGYIPRLARTDIFEKAVQRMCKELAAEFGLRVGTVDVILWRYMADKVGNYFSSPSKSQQQLLVTET